MIRRIATLLGLSGLAVLVCLAAALTSACGLPITKGGFQQQLSHGLGPVHERLDALDRKVTALEESTTANFAVANQNFQTLATGVEQATKRAEAAKSLGETTIKLLRPIGRDAATASKEATAGRKAAEANGQKIADAQKALGEKVDALTATTGAAVADVGRKVDTAAAESKASLTGLDQKVEADGKATRAWVVTEAQATREKVDATKLLAETAANRASDARDAANEAKTEAVAATKVRKDLADHATEAERARQDILRALATLSPPAPSH